MDSNSYLQTVPIKRVSFQVLTNKQVKKMSVVRAEINGINQTDMFTDGQATRGGLLDSRLGTTDPNSLCATCGKIPSECHGHFGHTDLAEPVFHFGFLDIVKNVLSCICLRCSKLLIYKNEDEIQDMLKTTRKGKARFAEIKKLTSNITYCARTDQNCGVPIPKIKKDVKKSSGIIQLIAETNLQNIGSGSEDGGQSSLDKKKKIREVLTPRMVYDILKNVDDNDYRIMGFDPSICRPEDFIIKVFPIPPIAIRPSVKMSISSTTNYEDMLTGKLVDIIKTNARIRKQLDKESSSGEEPKYLNENVQLLQYHIATFFDNENMSLPKSEQKSGGRTTKSISDRIRGKTGRVRGNLMGKRTDFSARTVITSDPNLSLDELGVPIKIAMNITFPEVVTPYNIDEMSKLVKNGRYIYPGANFVIPASSSTDGKKYTIDLRYRKKGIKLRPGDIVERHIRDGDPVLFNRQPSLHKLSMMCHKVKVINDSNLATFRINVSVTTPYNADFDGDEMNMFVPQSIQTQLELAHIADVSKQIITPRYSNPIIKLKQDTVLGTYQMTEKKLPIDWHDAMNILMNCNNIDLTKVKKENIDTHQLYSAIIPPLINIIDGDKLEINNGNLLKGTIGGSIINDKIINYSWDRYGPKITKDFIDNSQKLVINFLLQDGFTVGLGDAMIPANEQKELRKFMEEKSLEVQHLITEIENYPNLLDPETFEKQVYSLLSVIKGDLAKMVMGKLNSSNHFYGMIASKAKGNDINLGQIVGGLAQDILRFARIEKKVNNRTLVHFCQNDDTAEARGFIINSYYNGLEPHEFYFHHMTGREGLIDTAIKSVVSDTPLIIMENGKTKHINIGTWIDTLLDENKACIQLDDDRELLQLKHKTYIPTSDLDGKVSWGEITAITRHNPSEILYEIETHGGRNVIVTDSHSLLIWKEDINQFIRIEPYKIDVGSYVPVTAKLMEPPIINNYINITQFLPKTEYIHGTEFIKAVKMVNDVLKDRQRTPSGWWNSHNGTSFTLPYKKIQLFLRTLWRSSNDFIKENCIYPYGTQKNDCLIKDKFEFTEENGIFLGLYIAEGNSDIPSGYVQITNNDMKILNFVKNWFDNNNIKHSVTSKINHIGGLSTCIRGYSVLLAKILHNIAGHGARNKFIHEDCFSAPIQFIKGLINGIISGDGTITNNSIQLGSSSNKLINDVNVCLSRLNIFGKTTITHMKSNNVGTKDIADVNLLSIRSNWATIFKNNITLISDDKQEKLLIINPSDEHRNFKEHNDIVLDKIVSINRIESKNSKYSKVYDLTVPSTLNFGLANGLHVVDTADTGYLQRKLIKGMEDVYIAYDGTVRSGNNIIIQMLYGDSHLDQAMQKEVKFNILSWGNSKIIEKCRLSEDQLNEIAKNLKYSKEQVKELNEFNEEIVDIMKQFRDDLRHLQEKAKLNNVTMKDKFHQPANYSRIIDDAKNSMTTVSTPLDPMYIVSEIDRLMDPKVCRLVCVTANDDSETSPKYYNQTKAKYLFQIALYEYLGPKRCLYEYKFNKEKFDQVIKEIIKSFNNSTVEPGEMVGVIASQSLGEPLTQMSNTKETLIHLKIIKRNKKFKTIVYDEQIKKVKIGEFIDMMMDKYPDLVQDIPNHSNSTETDISELDEEYYICGVSQDETVKWNKISHLSRHPTNGSLVEIKTLSGRKITTTKSHNFLIRTKDGIVPIRAGDLKEDTRIPVARHIKFQGNKSIYTYKDYDFILNELFGWYCGIYLADGCISNNTIKITKDAPYIRAKCNMVGEMFNSKVNMRNYQGEYGPGIDYSINNKGIATLFKETFMTGSYLKKIPDWVHMTNLDFVRGLIRGYIDGDGNFSADRHLIRIGSRSKELIEDMSFLLAYFNIFTTNYSEGRSTDDKTLHCLGIAHKYAKLYKEQIGCEYPEKLDSLNKIIEYSEKDHVYETDFIDAIPEIGQEVSEISAFLKMQGNSRIYGRWHREGRPIGRITLRKYIDAFTDRAFELNVYSEIKNKLNHLESVYNADVIWDKIVEIKEIDDPKEYVYDFTVPRNETFMISNLICVHNTLNTFHSTGSGVAGMQGVPRFRELLSYSKNPNTPYMVIYMDKANRDNKEHAHRIASTLKYTILGELAEQLDIIYEPFAKSTDTSFYNTDDIDRDSVFFLNNMSTVNIENLPWLFRITLSKENIVENEISMLDIKSKFISFWNNNYSDLSSLKKPEKDVISKVLHGCIMTSFDSSDTTIVHFRFELSNVDSQILSMLQEILLNKFNIKGNENITGITKVDYQQYVSYENENQDVENIKEWAIYTTGIDMYSIRKFIGIDINRTYCNDINTIYQAFGIEAARCALIKEFENVFEGNNVNHTHIALLGDVMTNNGGITSIDRHGINRLDTDPMGRASFEKTIEQLLLAAAFNEVDYLRGVSSRIMVGRCIKGGTGLCNLILDTNMIENSELDDTNEVKIFGSEFNTLKVNSLLDDLIKYGGTTFMPN